MRTAKAWGISPDEWIKKPRWARATMMAFDQGDNNIKYWIAEDSRVG